MVTDVITKPKLQQTLGKEFDIACFVLLCDNKNFNTSKPSYALDLLGKPTFEWVTRVCPTRPVTIECKLEDNPLEVIRPYLREREYTLVLYGDTPLLTRANIDNILEFVASKGLNVCKLTRGYVFRTEFIKRVDEIFSPQTYYFNEDEFQVANNLSEFSEIASILQQRIIKFHQSRGVEFDNPSSVYIESDVAIGSGCKISTGVYLSGETEIGDNVFIGSNAKISNSKIGNFSNILDCKIYDSVIKDNCSVADNVVIDAGSFVGSFSTIGTNCSISATSIAQNVKIGSMCNLTNARIYREAQIGSCVKVLGEKDSVSRILRGAKVGDCSIIGSNVAVKEQTEVPIATTLIKTDDDVENIWN